MLVCELDTHHIEINNLKVPPLTTEIENQINMDPSSPHKENNCFGRLLLR